jgi:hypothetical protein
MYCKVRADAYIFGSSFGETGSRPRPVGWSLANDRSSEKSWNNRKGIRHLASKRNASMNASLLLRTVFVLTLLMSLAASPAAALGYPRALVTGKRVEKKTLVQGQTAVAKSGRHDLSHVARIVREANASSAASLVSLVSDWVGKLVGTRAEECPETSGTAPQREPAAWTARVGLALIWSPLFSFAYSFC